MLKNIKPAVYVSIFLLLIARCFSANGLNYKDAIGESQEHAISLSTLYGDFVIKEPVLIELIKSPSMQRLKLVRQYGIDYYTFKKQDYNRFDHSIGVFLLARLYGASLKEQVASLLHDVSHTAFSHIADFMYKKGDFVHAYQDDIHEQFIENCELKAILNNYGFSVADIADKGPSFRILEQDLPDICADRLEYNLQGGLVEGLLTQENIGQILQDLKFDNGRWYFISAQSAARFAQVSLCLTEHRWGSVDNLVRNTWASEMVKRALELDVISLHDFQSGSDEILWNKLSSCNDTLIQNSLHKLYHCKQFYVLDDADYDMLFKGKFRGIDPLVKTHEGFKRLTQLDTQFEQEYNRVKVLMSVGWPVKFIN